MSPAVDWTVCPVPTFGDRVFMLRVAPFRITILGGGKTDAYTGRI